MFVKIFNYKCIVTIIGIMSVIHISAFKADCGCSALDNEGSVHPHMSKIAYVCPKVNQLFGDKYRTCVNGTWTGNAPICEKVTSKYPRLYVYVISKTDASPILYSSIECVRTVTYKVDESILVQSRVFTCPENTRGNQVYVDYQNKNDNYTNFRLLRLCEVEVFTNETKGGVPYPAPKIILLKGNPEPSNTSVKSIQAGPSEEFYLNYVYIGLGCLAFVCVLVIIIVFVSKRKKRPNSTTNYWPNITDTNMEEPSTNYNQELSYLNIPYPLPRDSQSTEVIIRDWSNSARDSREDEHHYSVVDHPALPDNPYLRILDEQSDYDNGQVHIYEECHDYDCHTASALRERRPNEENVVPKPPTTRFSQLMNSFGRRPPPTAPKPEFNFSYNP